MDPVHSRYVSATGMYFISPTTLDELNYHDLSNCEELYGAPLYYAHRVDLHESLKDMATGPNGPGIPATVHRKSGVRSYVSTLLHSSNLSLALSNSWFRGERTLMLLL